MVPLSVRRRSKRGNVQKRHKQLLDLSLDVLIEIFLFLEPLDLLHLTRTSRALREFLLNRSKVSSLWKNVISNVQGFPPCPDHMSAPAYVHLAFVPACHGCFRPCETIEWELRMRCCPDCFPKMTIPWSSIRNRTSASITMYLPAAYKHYTLYDGGRDFSVFEETMYHGSSVSRLDFKAAESRKRSRGVSAEEFVAQRAEYWRAIRRHAELCMKWEHGRLEERAAQLSLVREQRIRDIKDKLKEMGWTDDIWSSPREYRFLHLPEVRKPEPLTPTEWVKIRPELVDWARKTRRDLIGNLFITTFTTIALTIQQELGSDPSLKVQPREIDIAMLPAVHAVFESDVLGIDIDFDTICNDLKKQIYRVLPPAIRKWTADTLEELEVYARRQLGLPPLSKPSSLPSVIFQCKRCSRSAKRRSRFTFDEALSHDHLYREKRNEGGSKHTGKTSQYDKLLARYHTHPRSIRVLQVDVTVSRRVENLIRRMGLNPSRVTHNELRRSPVKVVCGLCLPEVATQMNFEEALDHCLGTHIGDKEIEVWTRPSARKQNATSPM